MDAADFLPDERTLDALRSASQGCRGCDLYERATQTVFGEGPLRARLLLVGEQPGDQEDLKGHPFVGPAGGVLDRALAAAGIERSDVFLTNAVKHFKWEPRGRRRLHKKPSAREVAACHPWLEAEISVVGPSALACLGATAAQSFFGSSFRLSAHRGEVVQGPTGLPVVATIHPSAVLRMTDEDRERAFDGLVADLALAANEAGLSPA